jgi:hypothetical protein
LPNIKKIDKYQIAIPATAMAENNNKDKPKSAIILPLKNRKHNPQIIETTRISITCQIEFLKPFLKELLKKSFFIVCFFVLCIKRIKHKVTNKIPQIKPSNKPSPMVFPVRMNKRIDKELMDKRLRIYKTPGTR